MISQEDFTIISALDSDKRGQFLVENATQCTKTFLNLLSHVSKDQTIQYILVMIDDLLQVRSLQHQTELQVHWLSSSQEDRTRVEIFISHGVKHKENIWGPFLNLLNRQDGFIVNMAARIVAKLSCWGREPMPKSDLQYYLQWLKDQLTLNVSLLFLPCIWS